jgi:hypothetical protein
LRKFQDLNFWDATVVFARQFWFNIFQKRGLAALSSGIEESNFEAWWSFSAARLNGGIQKGFNSLVILKAWCIWRHLNECVFEGVPPSVLGPCL